MQQGLFLPLGLLVSGWQSFAQALQKSGVTRSHDSRYPVVVEGGGRTRRRSTATGVNDSLNFEAAIEGCRDMSGALCQIF